ncbi:hypothetical protein SESBI_38467 [Sesbania bispinosa]|nr:hypothetical protein SESBI_38467 [Sesbania bispinosa]
MASVMQATMCLHCEGGGADKEGRQNDDQVALIKSSVADILMEFEERSELEKKVEELQSRDDAGENDTEKEKRMRVRKELEKKTDGRGMYGRAIEFLEGALTIIPRPTLFDGEKEREQRFWNCKSQIQIWMAMAYKNLLSVAYKNVIGSL